MDYLFQYGLFLAKAATVVVALIFVVGSMAQMVRQAREQMSEQLEVYVIPIFLKKVMDLCVL